jgi:hypothetical protein
MKLGTMLLRDAVITLSQLEEALRAQVLFGGRLGTNLVELGFVDLNTLGLGLAKVLGVPLASQERFEAVNPSTVEIFPARLADEFLAFPLGPELRSPDTLGVALADPRKPVVDELAARLGGAIAPYVAPELRILYYIEKHYGVQRSARYLRPADRLGALAAERRRTQPGRELPGPVRFEPRSGRNSRPPAPARPEPRLSYLAACDAIDGASHRDEIADSILSFCADRFAATALLILRGNNAVGWRAQAGKTIDGVDQLAMPLGAASALQVAHDTGLPFRGPPPSAGRPIERQLWRALAIDDEPDEVAVVPVVVRKRVVNLIYVHPFPGAGLDPDQVDELAELALRAAEAYVRLIQMTKG